MADYKQFIHSKLTLNKESSLELVQIKLTPFQVQYKSFTKLFSSLTEEKEGVSPYLPRKSQNQSELFEEIVGPLEMGDKKEIISESLTNPKYIVLIYFPTQFETLRAFTSITLADFISSLSCSYDWQENTGGKTGANFIKTSDQRFVFKQISKKGVHNASGVR